MASNPYVNKVQKADGSVIIDISDTTAIASDVASGKYFYTASGEKVQGTASGGGGGGPAGEKQVNFIDYDGTILYSYTKEEANALTDLPANPSHTGLTAQGWNWTLAQIKAQLTAMPDDQVWVGQMYVTDDDKTRIYCHFEEGRLAPYLGICPNGSVIVDWGDGSATDTLTGTSSNTVKNVQHVYSAAGDYMITLTAASGTTFAFRGSSTCYSYILRKSAENNATSSGYQSDVYRNAIKKIELGSSAIIGNYSFYNCYSLESVTIPSTMTSIGAYAFRGCYSLISITIPSDVTLIDSYAFQVCYSLKSITIPSALTKISMYMLCDCHSLTSVTIPSGVTIIGNSAFGRCYSLTSVTIPSGVTSIGGSVFQNCYSLTSVTIPSGVKSIGGSVFQNCYSLTSVTIPSGVTSLGAYAFQNCYGLGEIHFLSTTPPTVGNSNVFYSLPTDCIIYVPTGHLSDYTSATNYPNSATYTYVEE